MNKRLIWTVGLASAALTLTAAAILLGFTPHWIAAALIFTGVAGLVTTTYNYPIGPAAPTAAQIANLGLSLVTVQVNMGDSDTTVLLTHGFGLSSAAGSSGAQNVSEIGAQFPLISWYYQSAETLPVVMQFVLTDSNHVTMSKGAFAGSGGTVLVAMLRPMSDIR